MKGGVKGWLRVLAPVGASIGGLVLLRLLGPDVMDQRQLHDFIEPLGQAAPFAFLLALAIRPLTLLPGTLFAAVGGMVFGTLMGTIYALMGSFLAACVVFGLARKLGVRPMKRLAGARYPALARAARKHDFQFALLACINPLLPTDMMLAAAAASGARFWPMVGGLMVGTLPGTFLLVQFGSGLAQGHTMMTVVSGVGLGVSLVLGAFLGRRVYKELNAPPQSTQPEPQPEAQAEPPASPAPRNFPLPRKDGLSSAS
ncbi:TVP38/TMEM64 family protein [Hyalangium sp.]|uniref:TVP38/TMEM64 family protein n=1 Tax=Hyalangium sp. TaxID=2028555 RepID=UPI002D676C08|nr:VTT domain-containing protein [Hyalangium sp.]HYH94484.1 VTT domain-containing protein [Hyalangium sp.]